MGEALKKSAYNKKGRCYDWTIQFLQKIKYACEQSVNSRERIEKNINTSDIALVIYDTQKRLALGVAHRATGVWLLWINKTLRCEHLKYRDKYESNI